MQDPPSPPWYQSLVPLCGTRSGTWQAISSFTLTPIRPRRRRFVPKPTGKRFRINDFIRVPEVRIIDERGRALGVMTTAQALQTARDRGFDLVEVNPVAQPPICKFLNWGAYQYQQEKFERKSKARQHKIEIKGIRVSLKIGKHDLDMRRDQALKFFERGDKVKVELILRGRERQHAARARQLMEEFVKSMGSGAYIESPLSAQGGRLSLLAGWKGPLPKREGSAETEDTTDEAVEGETESEASGETETVPQSTDTTS